MQSLVILGATGSIGGHTLNIVADHPDRYRVYALSAYSRMKALAQLAVQFSVSVVIVPTPEAKKSFVGYFLGEVLPEIRIGQEGLCSTVQESTVDTVVCAIVGTAGLPSAYAAAKAGKRILLANKEVLVSAGSLFMQAIEQYHATLLPIDSEHNAIFQCLPKKEPLTYLQKVIITASGGPFRQTDTALLAQMTPEQACNHPNWSMGKKISVDSATMLNKGLEVIEAKWLFNLKPEQIEVVIHPQSIIHSMVQFIDGSLLAQLGHHDMRIPISYALAYPQRISHRAASFDLASLTQLDFSAPDMNRYPCLGLAFEAMKSGDAACTVLNAANEIAVQYFLDKQIKFTDITAVIAHMLATINTYPMASIQDIIDFDRDIRRQTQAYIQYNVVAT